MSLWARTQQSALCYAAKWGETEVVQPIGMGENGSLGGGISNWAG
jgi:hypothetical protein